MSVGSSPTPCIASLSAARPLAQLVHDKDQRQSVLRDPVPHGAAKKGSSRSTLSRRPGDGISIASAPLVTPTMLWISWWRSWKRLSVPTQEAMKRLACAWELRRRRHPELWFTSKQRRRCTQRSPGGRLCRPRPAAYRRSAYAFLPDPDPAGGLFADSANAIHVLDAIAQQIASASVAIAHHPPLRARGT